MVITAEARLVLSASVSRNGAGNDHGSIPFGIGKRTAFNRCQHGCIVDGCHTDIPALGVAVVGPVIHREGDRAGQVARCGAAVCISHRT